MACVLDLDFDNSLGNSGSKICDCSGYLNDGTNTGSTLVAKPRWGNARNFDSIDDNVNLSNPNSLNPLTNLTVLAWIYPHTVTDWKQASVITKFGTGKYQWKFGLDESGRVRFDVYNTQVDIQDQTSLTSVPINAWTFIGGTHDSTLGIRVYRNSIDELGLMPYTKTVQNTDAIVYVGRDPVNARFFDGVIGNAWAFNTTLTQFEISQIYQQTRWQYGV